MTKYISAFVLLFTVLGLSSCDDDKATGAGDATIGFASSTYTYKESAGIVRIPVAFSGEPKNYPIVFDVVAEIVDGDKTLDELVHFTQIEHLKYAGDPAAPAFIEFEIYDDQDINESRHMQLTIASASGAEIVNGSAVVEIADNDNNPYERLWGNWTFTGISYFNGTTTTFDFTITGGLTDEEIEKNADKRLVCVGYLGNTTVGGNPIVWYIDYDAETETCAIVGGTTMFEVNADLFELGCTTTKIVTAIIAEDDYLYQNASILGKWSGDYSTITFDSVLTFAPMIYGDGEYSGSVWGANTDIVLTRKN